jgi:hypothetical protein
MRGTTLAALIASVVAVGPAHALDHGNLDEGRPLRLEDAYAISTGEWAFEAGLGATAPRHGPDRVLFPLEILYGAWPNLQLGLGTQLSTDPREIEDPDKSGDLRLSALYNLNQETLTLPAFGVKLGVTVPTGVDSSGVDVELTGIVTKSVDRLSLHVNASYEFLSGTSGQERDGRYHIVLGASYPIGAPRYTRTTLIADLFVQQAARRGEAEIVGAEIGFRHQLTPRIVLDAGAGSEFAGPSDRAEVYGTVGLSVGF